LGCFISSALNQWVVTAFVSLKKDCVSLKKDRPPQEG